MKAKIEQFKKDRLGDKKKDFVDTVVQEAPQPEEQQDLMDTTS